VRNAGSAGELIFSTSLCGFADNKGDVNYGAQKRWSRRRSGAIALSFQEAPKTAGWQDLLRYATSLGFCYCTAHFQLPRLATLQACILDTEESLSNIIREIDKILEGDVVGVLVSFIFFHPFRVFVHLSPFWSLRLSA
jgi:hypothetical protein